MSARFLTRCLEDPRVVFPRRVNDIMRDRRLTDAERLVLLAHWPSRDDYERGEVATLRERLLSGEDNAQAAD
jgi:hypothetical protein